MTDVSKIFDLESYIKDNMEAEDLEWVHTFVPGMYAREMIAQEGTIVTGAIHKQEHIAVFLSGTMLIPDGDGARVVTAPHTEVVQPGTKRVAVALTEIRFITFHPTNAKTVEEAEEELFTNDPRELPALLAYEPQGFVEYQRDKALEQREEIRMIE